MKFFIPLLLASTCLTIPPDSQAGAENLAKRITELAPALDTSPVGDAILDSRAEIEARAKCVPGSYGKKKKSCTPHCKGRGKCSRASSPGIGFVWVCTCPTARRDMLDDVAGAEE